MTTPDLPWTVVHCIYSVAMGGQEMVVLSLVECADRQRFAPRVLCFQPGGELTGRFRAANVPVDVLDVPFEAGPFKVLAALRRYLRHHQVAIVHTHNPTPHQYGALAAKWAGVPSVVHTKHGRNQLLTAKGRWLERLAGRLTDVVVPVSSDAADVARTTDHVPADRIEVIRNGVAIGPPVVRLGPPGWRIVHVARLNAVKDQRTLLHAVRRVADAHPAVQLHLVGDGEEREALERLTDELGLRPQVRFHGFTDDVRPFLADADLFVLSSVSEGIALTLLEAMAASLPVVATDVGGNREVVVPGTTGLLVPPRDPAALAAAITTVLHDPSRAAAMGQAGRVRVAEDFSLTRVAAAYEAIYLRLLANHGLLAPVPA